MFYYKLYGYKIISDLEMRQLVPWQEGMEYLAEIIISACTVPEKVRAEAEETGVKYIFRKDLSWLSNLTTWLVVENGERIGYCLKEGGNPEWLSSYILGFGMSMLAHQRGVLAIHCSAVADENGAVLIAGESGAGKSTVTTALLDSGYRLMADDMAFVETIEGKTYAWPAFPFQKLCRNVAVEKGYDLDKLIYINEDKDKFLVPYEGEYELNSVPIKAFIMLQVIGGEEVLVQEVNGLNRFHVYVNNLFLRRLLREKKYNPEFGQPCLQMAANVQTYCVGRPMNGNTTEQVIAEVLRIVAD